MQTNNKIREAINAVYASLYEHKIIYPKERWRLMNMIDAVFAEQPVRNCDVGTAEEQDNRMVLYCKTRKCESCPLWDDLTNGVSCEFAWAQMPYSEVLDAENLKAVIVAKRRIEKSTEATA